MGKYTIKKVGTHYSCNCPAWKFQRKPVSQRTCKHIQSIDPTYDPEETKQEKKDPPAIPLFSTYDSSRDIQGWWWSEKYDGCRVVWTGKELLTRTGIVVDAPQEFIDGLSKESIDGELWAGYDSFDAVVAAIEVGSSHPAWRKMRLMAFDFPGAPDEPFSTRYEILMIMVRIEMRYSIVFKSKIYFG